MHPQCHILVANEGIVAFTQASKSLVHFRGDMRGCIWTQHAFCEVVLEFNLDLCRCPYICDKFWWRQQRSTRMPYASVFYLLFLNDFKISISHTHWPDHHLLSDFSGNHSEIQASRCCVRFLGWRITKVCCHPFRSRQLTINSKQACPTLGALWRRQSFCTR